MGIHFSRVAFTYYPHKKKEKNDYVISDINFSVNSEDEFVVIVGHTGSGKSTIVQLMNALLLPTLGEVAVFGQSITAKKHDKLKDIRRKIGLVFQFPEYQLFEETVIKDVAFGPKNYRLDNPIERAKKALGIFGLTEKYYEKNPFRLSGGEMRKVAISGIMASDPEILILDEPTVGLDPLTKKELISLLQTINRQEKKTIIMITHDMDVLWQVATRVLVVDEKKIVFDGAKKDLFKEEQFVRDHSLDFPGVIKIMKRLNQKLDLKMNIYQDDIQGVYNELMRTLAHE